MSVDVHAFLEHEGLLNGLYDAFCDVVGDHLTELNAFKKAAEWVDAKKPPVTHHFGVFERSSMYLVAIKSETRATYSTGFWESDISSPEPDGWRVVCPFTLKPIPANVYAYRPLPLNEFGKEIKEMNI